MSDIETSEPGATEEKATSGTQHVNTIVVIDLKSANGRQFAKGIALAKGAPGQAGVVANGLDQCLSAEDVGQFVAIAVLYRFGTAVPLHIASFDKPNLKEFLAKAIPEVGKLFVEGDSDPEIVMRVSNRDTDVLKTALRQVVKFKYITTRAN